MAVIGAINDRLLHDPTILFAGFIEPFMTTAALNNLSCVGVNLIFENRIRVANLLPAIVIACFL